MGEPTQAGMSPFRSDINVGHDPSVRPHELSMPNSDTSTKIAISKGIFVRSCVAINAHFLEQYSLVWRAALLQSPMSTRLSAPQHTLCHRHRERLATFGELVDQGRNAASDRCSAPARWRTFLLG